MTRKLLIALETQLLHPPPWRALQLGVVALHSSGVRFVSVVFYFVLFCLSVLVFFFSPSCTCQPDTQGERGVGSRRRGTRPHSRTSRASLCCSTLDTGPPFSAPLSLSPPDPAEEPGL